MNTEVTVREAMDREYVGVSESDGLVETVELLLQEDAETAVVLRGSDPVGVVTERDVLAMVAETTDLGDAAVADAMTESVPTVSPDETLAGAADRMAARTARRLVVTDGDEPLGIISERDLLAARTYEPATARPGPEEPVPGDRTGPDPATATEAEPGAGTGTGTGTETEGRFGNQGICEVCGTLARDLAPFNGQLLCADCRDV